MAARPDPFARLPARLAPAELELRRRAARRLAWLLGTVALLLYALGFLVSR